MQIVLAKLVEDFVVTSNAGVDLGHRPKVQRVWKAVALMWLQEGAEADVVKATAFAATEGYVVVRLPASEGDPLGKARQTLLEKHDAMQDQQVAR